jgi:hypothetical protein
MPALASRPTRSRRNPSEKGFFGALADLFMPENLVVNVYRLLTNLRWTNARRR